ncbi:hypothetical protein [Novosphingobium cyanobacteriorum]|uniref:Uncharacterized protein n=1 Tax=Novosphingobium cyanobacteriorum TaxID=3024215 RepID=A0ABT6CKE9_9SPHN|nr:hypothetical protein [Novosphingobium cyanobacteriorum]MDF8334385.1 hypothetical protein [Novosphingobium cyanobacteriorum]
MAERLPLSIDQSDWTVPPGCDSSVSELDLGEGEWLFFMGARCNGSPITLSVDPDHAGQPGLRAIHDIESGRVVAYVTVAEPDPHAQILAIARAGLSQHARRACAIGTSPVAGVPDGAWVLISGDRKLPDRDCGPFGAGPDGDAYWFQVGRHLFFIPPGNTQGAQPFDPATFNVVRLADVGS